MLCFCCRRKGLLEHCHVVGQADRDFQYFRQIGILKLSRLGLPENGIMLCGACHSGFDYTWPYWYILPLELDFFISFEKTDYKARKQRFRDDGTKLRRSVPTAVEYKAMLTSKGLATTGTDEGGVYHRLLRKDILDDNMTQQGIGVLPGAFHWHGNPMAALRHLFKALQYPGRWLDKKIRGQLLTLVDLYEREDPWQDGEEQVGDPASSSAENLRQKGTLRKLDEALLAADGREVGERKVKNWLESLSVIVKSEPDVRADKAEDMEEVQEDTQDAISEADSDGLLPLYGPTSTSADKMAYKAMMRKIYED
ncbi:hypothetical protein ABW21_db0204658 [Orbilia brochopaga]|nr:hypothetical protein ABW21_db0204658 [Drechslerella brochopaga]